jgi:cyclic pyranopterin phosphate synthase
VPRSELLSFEDITHFVAHAALPLGINRLRITGGEPLVRRNLSSLIGQLKSLDGVRHVALTTNAVQLKAHATSLYDAGLDGINISLDSLDLERFKMLTRLDRLSAVRAGVDAAAKLPFQDKKINCVPIRGINDDELGTLVAFGLERGFQVRFIEFMPFGSQWTPDRVMHECDVVKAVERVLGPAIPNEQKLGETARIYTLSSGATFGIIPTISSPFCGHCNRLRLSATGQLMPCLFSNEGEDVRKLLRAKASPLALQNAVRASLAKKGIGFLEEEHGQNKRLNAKVRDMRRIGG